MSSTIHLNRSAAPAFHQVGQIDIIRPEIITLDNGQQVYAVNAGEQELVRIEFIFGNTGWDPRHPLRSYATNTMLVEGTAKMSGAELARYVDFYGAFMQAEYSFDHSSLVLFTLNKHIGTLLPVIKAILADAQFPQKELDTFKKNARQKLIVSLEKNDVLARRKFNEVIFGNSAYGYGITTHDYDRLERQELEAYFREAYGMGNCTIVAAGRISKEVILALNKNFGAENLAAPTASQERFRFTPGAGEMHYTERPGALQSAIRIGKLAINRAHPDFPGLQVLNTILGGYFGSRLMTNIREDKGYTYGIGSGLASMQQAGYLFIASEVGADVCNAALAEIEKEIGLLKTQPVPADELALVRNYMMGSFLGDLENAFSHADKFKNIHFYGLGYDYYDRYIDVVKTIGSETLLDLANKYLDYKGSEKVVVGKK